LDTENKEESTTLAADEQQENLNPEAPQKKGDFDFEAVIKANAEKAQKLKQERQKSNTSVKRSYRLTPKR